VRRFSDSARKIVFAKLWTEFPLLAIFVLAKTREFCVREDVEKLFFCSRLVCWNPALSPELRVRERRQRFALGVVIRGQNEVTFEVTETSFRFATCKAYDEV
jgi:hypothetical protein